MANEKYIVYMGTEKFRPAEGYFALGEAEQDMYTDESNVIEVGGSRLYLSPWVWTGKKSDASLELMPYIYAYSDNPKAQSIVCAIMMRGGKGSSTFFIEGNDKDWRDVGLPGNAALAYLESGPSYIFGDISYVVYIKVYILEDYDVQSQGGWTESDLDNFSNSYITLYPKQKGNRYIWSTTP